ncbi:putative glutathione S-transferase-related transmembrane protein [Pseudonocardia sp. Ae406_Ps2]|uniref:SRPBCC family protein n=1 Tax=unclassified Pseudonocardia TaxID=2619320 RepID=UPI00094B311F|nr:MULTISPECIES: SRPBCC family protein [unclassified Pseudonocardia]OLM01352.1 putative glutathione S-transferase-related transmembrane protein [Pseudonocardia sp. Ae406_Ps2]OLM06852.1 putative glutathione S-transferase-related transmembrane protein [Pseudonocardia sp. Ae331_Ps2]OLM14864.1 putative glutathione S-transferase-related transmembrane protein [Pseudonocardia sp. Ae505_Ps2]OLM22924.1 putative glutathione S-transferase-related transmembrane protein [Pseudonocardia sp. Ae706_Ps2]OLM320
MSTTGTRGTAIDTVEDLPAIRVTREFEAPPERVFRAHVEVDEVRRWLGPRRLRMTVDRWDAVTGGGYRYTHADDDGEYRFFGSFHEVRAPERIVQTFTFEGFGDSVCLETMTLTPLPGDRTRLVAESLYDSWAARDAMLASGMEVGVNEGYERLDELLASR